MAQLDTDLMRPTAAARPARVLRVRPGRLLVSIVAAILVLVLPSTANAISYGVPDNGEHPNVGSFVAEYTDPATGQTAMVQLCTGTLIAADVVLSASHCFSGAAASEFGRAYFTLAEVIDANRDGVVDSGVPLLSGTPVTHPLYGVSPGAGNPYDIAVFRLDHPVTGVAPAPIAPLGYLDGGAARQQTYTAVGYGTVRTTSHQAWQALGVGWRREKVDQHLLSLTKAWASFSMNAATGNGGTCYGDSGGPHFAGRTVVSITISGDRWCKALDRTYRLDTPWAREFLSQFVTLP